MTTTTVQRCRIDHDDRTTHYDNDDELDVKLRLGDVDSARTSLLGHPTHVLVSLDVGGEPHDVVELYNPQGDDVEAVRRAIKTLQVIEGALTGTVKA